MTASRLMVLPGLVAYQPPKDFDLTIACKHCGKINAFGVIVKDHQYVDRVCVGCKRGFSMLVQHSRGTITATYDDQIWRG